MLVPEHGFWWTAFFPEDARAAAEARDPGPDTAPLVESLLELDQAILDALPLGIYACDVDGQIIRINRRAVELWGRAPRLHDPAQRFCGSFRVESLEGDFIPPDQTPMAHAVRAGESFEGVEAVVHNPDGKRWVARVNVAPLRDADGSVIGAINSRRRCDGVMNFCSNF